MQEPTARLLAALLWLLLALSCAGPARAAPAGAGASELDGKVVVGYQGWFGCPGDAGVAGMMHWDGGSGPTVEMLPDLAELPEADRCLLPGAHDAAVYSGANPDVIDMHFRWMRQYGIATAAVQRFVSVLRSPQRQAFFDRELHEIAASAEKHGVAFFVEYDLSGSAPGDAAMIEADWAGLVRSGLAASPAYQRVRGRPLVGLWGLGFAGRPWTPDAAAGLVGAVRGHGASVMAGVPSGWRTGRGDAAADPGWMALWPTVDVLSPWTVGRFADDAGAARFSQEVMRPDAAWADRAGVVYLPTAFPGFSWSNLKHGASPRNQIPRRCGDFLRAQLDDIRADGVRSVLVAMFDEVDEGTAIYKTLPHRGEGDFLALDADGCALASDHYLGIVREEAGRLAGGK